MTSIQPAKSKFPNRMVIQGVQKNRLKLTERASNWSTALNFNQTVVSQAETTHHKIPATNKELYH
jgi:pterin-4a-carbinolamine dehydratase